MDIDLSSPANMRVLSEIDVGIGMDGVSAVGSHPQPSFFDFGINFGFDPDGYLFAENDVASDDFVIYWSRRLGGDACRVE